MKSLDLRQYTLPQHHLSKTMTIPSNVREYIKAVFRSCNTQVTNKLSKFPSFPEPSLDTTLIDHLSHYTAPRQFGDGWVVGINTHFIGGLQHWGKWEIADIGVLLIFKENGKITK